MDDFRLKSNMEYVLERVHNAAYRAGTDRVEVVAATKNVGAETVNAAIQLGLNKVGENRVQEYVAKRDAVKGAEWHFIGTLQCNKAKYLVGNVALIQSVSNERLASEIDRLAKKLDIVQDVLVEVNIGGEGEKTGAPLQSVDRLMDHVGSLANVRVRGLMAVPPIDADDGVYKKLYAIYRKFSGGVFDTLSVGMSGDYERAIYNGSNMVRIGTALFGPRNYK